MISSLWTAASGMAAQQLNVDVIANNLANVNTTGFKKSNPHFEDLLYTFQKLPGTTTSGEATSPTGIQVGHGVRPVTVAKVFTQGDFVKTETPTDILIEGDGFFKITMPDGTLAYTRDGSFKLDGEGRLTTADGLVLDPEITIPQEATDISIGIDGTVSVEMPGQVEPQTIGTIDIVRFINPSGLKAIGMNLFVETDASGAPVTGTPGQDGFGMLRQGFLEMSNVKVVEEMVNMIVGQRAYELNSKAIQTADDMMQVVNSLKRG